MAKRKFIAVSAYTSDSWDLREDGRIDVKDIKGNITEIISPNTMLHKFCEAPTVKCYGIIKAYIWDCDERKVVEYFDDLPGSTDKAIKNQHKIVKIYQQIKSLQQQLENF